MASFDMQTDPVKFNYLLQIWQDANSVAHALNNERMLSLLGNKRAEVRQLILNDKLSKSFGELK